MYKGIRLGVAAGEHRFESFFFLRGWGFSISPASFYLFYSQPECVCHFVVIFISLFVCYSVLHFTFNVLSFYPQLLTRYAKMSSSFQCRGREPQLVKLSTTSVQQILLVSGIKHFKRMILLANYQHVIAFVHLCVWWQNILNSQSLTDELVRSTRIKKVITT